MTLSSTQTFAGVSRADGALPDVGENVSFSRGGGYDIPCLQLPAVVSRHATDTAHVAYGGAWHMLPRGASI